MLFVEIYLVDDPSKDADVPEARHVFEVGQREGGGAEFEHDGPSLGAETLSKEVLHSRVREECEGPSDDSESACHCR